MPTNIQELIKAIGITTVARGSLYYQPKQCTIVGEIPENYQTFALFDPPKIG